MNVTAQDKINSRLDNGQSLVEMIVSVGVVSLVLVGLISAITYALANAQFARNKASATKYAQEALEWMRHERDSGWGAFAGRSDQTYCLTDLSWLHAGSCEASEVITGTAFMRQATLTTNATSDRVDIELVVIWAQGTRTPEVKLNTYLSKYQ